MLSKKESFSIVSLFVRLSFLWIGATRRAELSEMENCYLERIGHHLKADRLIVPEARKHDGHQAKAQIDRETSLIERRIRPGTYVVVMDEQGQQMTSRQLSEFLKDLIERGTKDVTFVVGGAFGLPEAVRNRADKILALSRMTLPHELARTVLLEQVYRAITIWKGLPYHK